MLLLLVNLLAVSDLAVPHQLHRLTAEDAARLHGKTVTVWLEVGKPV